MHTLAIDFGTSNSAAGLSVNGAPWLIEMEPGESTLPTAVFFDPHSKDMLIGHRAVRALINGEEGRFLRALKSLLGTPLLHEERRLGGEKLTFVTVIARFLAELKQRAEAATRLTFTQALSGRPVYFHSADMARNAKAEEDLRACYLEAGFESVTFMYEPIAALRATAPVEGFGLIADIGGGTSDFTVFKQDAAGKSEVLASHGLRLGGTDFDRQISIETVMPHFGAGSNIRDSFGKGTQPAPKRLFNELATWQLIPFVDAPETRRLARDLAQFGEEPDKLARLVNVLEYELGHDVAFAVESGKINANKAAEAEINLTMVEPRLKAPLPAQTLAQAMRPLAQQIKAEASNALALADVPAAQVNRVILVGGSALMGLVQTELAALCPNASLDAENALTAVAAGLALSTAD
ncbi:Hsp70 family protein [Lentibacter algarum]|uniref:Hsp70 family protein n=1 Tax=Lentibacter algarum TaxID=576131 RepID=UPI001C09D942|nr:Hsp70 family protein [Lentibacter algarum]MBU2982682.1 Hsp70 family protein [Lentibacter algarum]